jgi:hypothetical protein
MVLPLFPRYVDSVVWGLGRGGEPRGAKVLRLIPTRLSHGEFGKNVANLSNQFAASANRRFEFDKRRQLFIRVDNETLSVVAMRVCNRFVDVGFHSFLGTHSESS